MELGTNSTMFDQTLTNLSLSGVDQSDVDFAPGQCHGIGRGGAMSVS